MSASADFWKQYVCIRFTYLLLQFLVDYKMLSVVQQRVYQSQVHNVDDLKERLLQVWNDMDHSIVNSAVDQWRQRLRACVWTKGGHFEQLLWQYPQYKNVSFFSPRRPLPQKLPIYSGRPSKLTQPVDLCCFIGSAVLDSFCIYLVITPIHHMV